MGPNFDVNAADRALLDALPAAIYVTDTAGNITYYNAAARELWGESPAAEARWNGFPSLFSADGAALSAAQDPTAQALRTCVPLHHVELVGERRDGSRVRFLSSPTPLRGADGAVTGAINILIDVSERSRAEADAERLAAIVASSQDAIVSKTLDGIITSWNRGAAAIFGYEESEMLGKSIFTIIPPDLHPEEERVLERLRNGERIGHFETTRVAKDGRLIDVSLTISPLRDKSGKIVGASKVGRDITARKQAERTQALLIGELSHRVKNTLATVQAIATQSLRRSRDPAEFVASFSGRVQSLARSHDLLSEAHWEGMSLAALVHEQVLLGTGDARMSWGGPDLVLEPQPGLHLALVLHELGTNARKHGALSVPYGRLTIDWQVVAAASGRELTINWREEGGPRPAAPSSHGFGTTLIEGGLTPHGGSAIIAFGAHGVSCRLVLPLPSLPLRSAMPSGVASTPRTVARGDVALHGKRILVVEDEPLIAMEIVATLQEAGCAVAGPTANVAAAVALVEAGCDGALLDANLSGEPVGELAATLTRAGVPFAFVTGYDSEALPPPFRSAPLLRKPFTSDRLVATVTALFARRDFPEGRVVSFERPAAGRDSI